MRSAGGSHCVSACHRAQGDAFCALHARHGEPTRSHSSTCAEAYTLLRFQGHSGINLRAHQLYVWLRGQPSPLAARLRLWLMKHFRTVGSWPRNKIPAFRSCLTVQTLLTPNPKLRRNPTGFLLADAELCSLLCEPKSSVIIGYWTGEGLI